MKQLAQLIPYLLAYRYLGVFLLNYLTSDIVPLPGATIGSIPLSQGCASRC